MDGYAEVRVLAIEGRLYSGPESSIHEATSYVERLTPEEIRGYCAVADRLAAPCAALLQAVDAVKVTEGADPGAYRLMRHRCVELLDALHEAELRADPNEDCCQPDYFDTRTRLPMLVLAAAADPEELIAGTAAWWLVANEVDGAASAVATWIGVHQLAATLLDGRDVGDGPPIMRLLD